MLIKLLEGMNKMTYSMYNIMIDVVGTSADSVQELVLYIAATIVSLITIFFVIYMFKVIAGIISPHNYK